MEKIKKLSKFRNIILVILDICCIAVAYFLGVLLVSEDTLFNISEYYAYRLSRTVGISVIVYQIVFHITKRYKHIIRYEDSRDYIWYFILCIISSTIVSVIREIFNLHIATPKLNILAGIFIAMLMVSYRVIARYILVYDLVNKGLIQNKEQKKNLLIIGAGNAAHEIIKTIHSRMTENYEIIGIIDDNPKRLNYTVAGVKIIGNRNDIVRICKENNVEMIFFSIANIDSENKKHILNICQATNAKVRILPGMKEIIKDKKMFDNLRDVEIEDILGRDPIKLDNKNIENLIKDKIILVTGAGGSIGSELCRQIVKYKPECLVMLDIYENNLYDIEMELKAKYPKIKLEAIIASVRDKKRLEQIFENHNPYLVFHAAAHKHVPLMENSPLEAIKNNVFGTYNVVNASDKFKVKRFILISTDKAVNPTNIMGATKRMCEMIVQAKNKQSETEFAAVRFGNVLGSNGSVVPLFKKQIAEGGPVTVTHKEITRFFMTIPEAVELVLQAMTYANGGEIFVLDMGEPVKIYDLAVSLIKLSGYIPDEDIEIKVTGLRPGEKLYEELLMGEEGLEKTAHNKIFVAEPMNITMDDIKEKLDRFDKLLNKDNVSIDDIKEIMKQNVPTFQEPEKVNKRRYIMKKIYLASPHMSEEKLEEKYVKEAFDTNWLSSVGENINKFEEAVTTYLNVKSAVALSSGTSAIHLGLKALGVEKEDIVFVSDLTFSASVNPIIYQNATPVFIDSEPDTWNMSPKALEKAFEKYPNPKAVVVVHLYGHAAKIEEIMEICKKHNVPILEDAAEGLGTTYKGKFLGTFGKFGALSFNGNKIITTTGGGMLVSNDEEKIAKARFWSTQSKDPARHYQHSEIGYNYRMSNVLAGIGRGQMQVLEKRISKKQQIFNYYKFEFRDINEIEMMKEIEDERSNYWLSTMLLKPDSKVKPLDIIESLEKENIESRPIWKPMHMQPICEKYDFINHNENGISVGEDLFNRGICLPSDTKNTIDDMQRITYIIKSLF